MAKPENNDMFERSAITNHVSTRQLHEKKRKEVEVLENRFKIIHKDNMRKDAPFSSIEHQEKVDEIKADIEMMEIYAAYDS